MASRDSVGLRQVRTGLKQAARRGVDRVARPYVEEVVARLTDLPPVEQESVALPPPPEVVLHHVLHTARTIALAEMPLVTGTLLSAGPNGKWYFDWLDSAYGQVRRHIAVEAFTPKPADLPSNVEWIEADIAAPEGIAAISDSEVDLLFSGQNLEHLWPHQVVSFLVESNRVIHPGGWLVVDSPNRNMTSAYRWSMSEHTVEFSPDEAQSLLDLAGFEVRSMRGLWLCRRQGQLLPLHPNDSMGIDMLDRLSLSARHPEDSFIWWAEAVKVAEPRRQALQESVRDIFGRNWEERVNRLQPRDGAEIDESGGLIRVPKGTLGYPVLGPYMPLPPGSYQLELPISWHGCENVGSEIATLEVVLQDECVASIPIVASAVSGSTLARTEVNVAELSFALHVRLLCSGTADIQVPLKLSIEPEPWKIVGRAT